MKILTNLVMIILSLAILAGAVFYESFLNSQVVKAMEKQVTVFPFKNGVTVVRGGQKISVDGEYALKQNDEIITGDSQSAEIRFYENAVVRVEPKSSVLFALSDNLTDSYALSLKNGQVWVNTSLAAINLNVFAGLSVIIPDGAVFNLNYDGIKSNLWVFTNQVEVGLLKSQSDTGRMYVPHDKGFVNYYLVPQGNQSSVVDEKVISEADAIAKLLYSKLVKEFQVGVIDRASVANEAWYNKNLDLDRTFKESVSRNSAAIIDARNIKITDLNSIWYQVKKLTDAASNALIMSRDKQVQRYLDDVYTNLYDSEYLFQYGRSTEGTERLNLFIQSYNDLKNNSDDDVRAKLLKKLTESYNELSYVYPDDRQFGVKVALRELLMQNLSMQDINGRLALIREDINYAYDLANKNRLNARLSLERYFKNLSTLLSQQKNLLRATPYLMAEENAIMDNLFKQNSVFYQDSFFQLKRAWESEYLALLPNGSGKDEEKQTIVSNKIDFLKQLQFYFLQNQVPLQEAQKIAFRLINEIKDLMTGEAVGINELFAVRLKDYGVFLRFLNSDQVVNLRGTTIQASYNQFVKTQSGVSVGVEEFLQETGNVSTAEESLTVAQIAARIKSDFSAIEVLQVDLGEISSPDQELVRVTQGFINNISFSAVYDWKLKLISNVVVEGKTLIRSAVSLDKFKETMVPPETQQVTQEIVITEEQVSLPGTQLTQGQTTQTQLLETSQQSQQVTETQQSGVKRVPRVKK